MKKELLALLLLIGLGVGAFFNLRYLHRFTEELSGQVETLRTSFASADWPDAEAKADELLQQWTAAGGYTHIFIRHSEIDSLTEALCSLITAVKSKDTAEFEGASRVAVEKLKSLYGMERLTPGSIL